MTLESSTTTLPAPADLDERRRALRRMKAVATGVLIVLAIIFVIAFSLQDAYPAWGYVRAAAEGGMVGALADWFAVTAIFRHPLGIPIPHTAIIPRKKDQLGESLGTFFQTNFLESEVMAEKLTQVRPAGTVGAWLAQEDNATQVGEEVSRLAVSALKATDDTRIRELLADLVAKHMIGPDWSPTLGTVLQNIIDEDHHTPALEILVSRVGDWVAVNQDFFISAVKQRSPGWVPSVVDRLLGERIHKELLGYLRDVQFQPEHELRTQVRDWLQQLADDMRYDETMRAKVENLKHSIFADPQVAELTGQAWNTAKNALVAQLADTSSDLHRALVRAIADIGNRLQNDRALAQYVDDWAVDAAQNLAARYGPQLVQVIGETIQRWDGKHAAETMELYAGRDLQFIRINGSIVGSLAGLAIYTLAQIIIG